MSATCPWCDAPRESGPRCSRCGAIYAKAEALKAGADPIAIAAGVEPSVAPLSLPLPPPLIERPETPPWSGTADERATEVRLRAAAIPVALVVALLFHASSVGHFLQRTFLTMMVHEVGHAVTAWWCGFAAVPFLWRTWIAESRGLVTPLAVAAANTYLIVWSARGGKRGALAGGIALLVLQIGGTLLLRRSAAQALIIFGGDGGAMVLGTLLMASFFFGRETQLYQGALRWGFLVIGAAAFVDTFATWWQARSDEDVIPFGEIEGVGLSDPSKLTDIYAWTTRAMVSRYVTLGVVCLIALAVVWSWGVWQARREIVSDRAVTAARRA